LYEEGYPDEQGELVKVNLDVAASMVGLSRKTLDDYYAQLRKAERFKFDFEKHTASKMGVLRKFVKDRIDRKDLNEPFSPPGSPMHEEKEEINLKYEINVKEEEGLKKEENTED